MGRGGGGGVLAGLRGTGRRLDVVTIYKNVLQHIIMVVFFECVTP